MFTKRWHIAAAAVAVLYAFTYFINPAIHFDATRENVVVITGASSGLGRDAALRLAREGWTVFAGVRKAADGAALEEAWRAEQQQQQGDGKTGAGGGGGPLRPLKIDVAKPGQVAAAVGTVGGYLIESANAGRRAVLAGLVNNAGIQHLSAVEEIDLARARRLFDVNVWGLVATTQARKFAYAAGQVRRRKCLGFVLLTIRQFVV